MGLSPAQVLTVYRRILKAAARYPSVKRPQIIRDIKVEFREGRACADAAEVQTRQQAAVSSLEQLEAYAGVTGGKGDWNLSLAGGGDAAGGRR